MRDVSATEAALNFSSLLDEIEHGHESFRVTRSGRTVARIVSARAASGRSAKDLLERFQRDPAWDEDLAEIRGFQWRPN